MEKILFALIRLGLGTSSIEKENLSDFIMLSAAQWLKIGDLSREQGVLGIVLDGIEVLENTRYGLTRDLPAEKKLQWIGEVLQGYETGNKKQLSVIDSLQKKWAENGIRMMVMKGQALGIYYPAPMHRSPGDIDCYLFDDYAKGNELACSFADKVDDNWYKHSVISFKGETVENHQYFVHTREGKSSKRLNQILCDTLKGFELENLPGMDVLIPSPKFNAYFLTYHALSHFLEEGLRLKQLIDWAMFLKHNSNSIDWPEFYKFCDHYHFRRFAIAATDIAVNIFGVRIDNPCIECNSPFTEKILRSTFYDRDYVFACEKGGWSNRWHILKNLFKYRWKYHEIYQHSILRQLWLYAIGFIFKTDK